MASDQGVQHIPLIQQIGDILIGSKINLKFTDKYGKDSIFPITKTRLFKYIENFISKNCKFSDEKNSDIFPISAQNIDCGNSLEPPRRGGSNEYQ